MSLWLCFHLSVAQEYWIIAICKCLIFLLVRSLFINSSNYSLNVGFVVRILSNYLTAIFFQLDVPQNNFSLADVAWYGARWVFSFVLIELITHLFYYNAFAIRWFPMSSYIHLWLFLKNYLFLLSSYVYLLPFFLVVCGNSYLLWMCSLLDMG